MIYNNTLCLKLPCCITMANIYDILITIYYLFPVFQSLAILSSILYINPTFNLLYYQCINMLFEKF